MISVPLLRDLGPRCLRRPRVVLRAAILSLRGFRFRDAEDGFVDRPVARVDREADLVALLRLCPGALRLRRQFLATVVVNLEQGRRSSACWRRPMRAGRQTNASPSTVKRLSSSPSAKRSSCQTMAKASRSASPNFASLAKKRVLLQRLRDLPPDRALALLWLELLPHRRLILARGRGDRAQFLFLRHVARADLIEDRRVDGCEQAQLADLADGNCERGGDRLFGPVFGGEAFDRAP